MIPFANSGWFSSLLHDTDSTLNVPTSVVRTITGASILAGIDFFFATAQIGDSVRRMSSPFAFTSHNYCTSVENGLAGVKLE